MGYYVPRFWPQIAEISLGERNELTSTYNEMVQNLDVEQPAGFNNRTSKRNIVRAWSRIPAGMIVSEDDRNDIVDDRLAEDLRYTNLGRIYGPFVQNLDARDTIARIKIENPKLFMIQ